MKIIASQASTSTDIYATNFGKFVNVNPLGWTFTGVNMNISNNGGSRFYPGASCGSFLAEGNSVPFQNTNGILMKGAQPGISTATVLVNTTGFSNICVSFGVKKSSSGYNNSVNYKLEWSNDGINYFPISFIEPNAGSWRLISESGLALPAAASNQLTLYLKWTFNRTLPTANLKIDDFKVCGVISNCFPVYVISEPVSTSLVCSGQGTATFSVGVNGTGPFSYQWQEDLVNISDNSIYSGSTTATLTLNNPSLALNGKSYRCIISNCSGATVATNNAAFLIFDNSALPLHPLGSTLICQGDSVSLATAYIAGVSYQWYQLVIGQPQQEIAINGATSELYRTGQEGEYFLKAIYPGGCNASSNHITVNVRDLPDTTILINGPLTFCEGSGSTVILTATNSPGVNYLWSTGQTTSSITVRDSGFYWINVTEGGCQAQSSFLRINTYRLFADIDSDGYIGNNDYLLLLVKFDTPCPLCREDINEDGMVDNYDFLDFLEQYGLSCP